MVSRILSSRLKPASSIPTQSSGLNTATNTNNNTAAYKPSKKALPMNPNLANTGLVLKVEVLKGRNLAAKDRNGTSDPYLVLSLGEARITTHSVSKTLNPEWNVSGAMPVNSLHSLVLDVICWDKDRFGRDYMGEFDITLEEIFSNNQHEQMPKWYSLHSRKSGRKQSNVSGEVQLQFTLIDSQTPNATPGQIMAKFSAFVSTFTDNGTSPIRTKFNNSLPRSSKKAAAAPTAPVPDNAAFAAAAQDSSTTDGDGEDDDEDLEDLEDDDRTGDISENRRRRLRIRGLKKKRRNNPYEFSNGGSDMVGIIYLEVIKITDLPPESNLTRTSFDVDPFVVASLGKKTYRTRRVRHNLNPIFNEKMIFQVMGHEQSYKFLFTVIDHDRYSGNDFIASCDLSVQDLVSKAPRTDPETGVYLLRDPPEHITSKKPRRLKIPISRSSSAQSLTKMMRPSINRNSTGEKNTPDKESPITPISATTASNPALLKPSDAAVAGTSTLAAEEVDDEDDGFTEYALPLKMKNIDKWEDKHNPVIYIRAKYMPYQALRQQFWRAMMKQYDSDESGEISRVELTTMLDTLGSTLRESTIDSFFKRFPHKSAEGVDLDNLTIVEAIICLEDQLEGRSKQSIVSEKFKGAVDSAKALLTTPMFTLGDGSELGGSDSASGTATTLPMNAEPLAPNDEPDLLDASDPGEEHVVEIAQCPICHQPRLNKRSDADIVTHMATCASSDWRQVNDLMMGGFVTASQAQRKWYSKVITKISYGGYKLGANSANILVQDRLTGQINEEKMSVYVRLGIRLLYKGLKSSSMERRRIRKLLKKLSVKQGDKYDDPASRDQIEKFIAFHRLDMSEVLLPLKDFKNFNEFFYRALKPGARPCSAPDNSKIVVSPADCRSVVFNRIDQATKIWVKGREFSIKRLLGDAYPEDVSRYEGGALGIFRLAPQDYHRFHIPVDGIMGQDKLIAGEYYTVNPMAIRSALDVYGENVRILVPIDSKEHGRVMVVCVGAMMVGSTVITRKAGSEVKRGEELGYFKFGGSTILCLFEPGKVQFDDDLCDNSTTALETLIRVGMSIGHSPDEPQWSPDQRKNSAEVTEADKKEAKRRIQGSVNPDSSEASSDEAGDATGDIAGGMAPAGTTTEAASSATAPVVVPVITKVEHPV
ncbi:Phosphatidylserine decarboxylase proenzyme 2 [Ceratocystis fimbriata CBS 114723]|uniref:Phosphatidylserine decarboxylase proenzyme 2 n=1 Tax=Ceratocystis fimbriata CBS 114723 TaxID=1035309 RepID=A0A2C5WX90_9PEZI|nr:Phosphatidylserine decarboxylase proenzyme 2 [Ceratocystis fimbriata CBS 114723]